MLATESVGRAPRNSSGWGDLWDAGIVKTLTESGETASSSVQKLNLGAL